MVNITHKKNSLRIAIAQAVVKVGSVDTIHAVHNRKVPKGDVLEVARTAGLFAAKRTSDMIPDCHPLPVEFTSIQFELKEQEILIFAEIHTVYKTGVEVEAMHAASVAALTVYDMLKPIDKQISIEQIRLLEKQGGKSDFRKYAGLNLSAAVVVCSDSVSAGLKEDQSGRTIVQKLEHCGVRVENYKVIPDQTDQIQEQLRSGCAQNLDIIIFTGGTGLSPKDMSPEAVIPLLQRRIPGIEEAMRAYGLSRTPLAMLSRSVAGLAGQTLVLCLPGSVRGAAESMDAIFPEVLHIFHVMEGKRHN